MNGEEGKKINVAGKQFLFFLKDEKLFYKFTEDFGKTYSQEHEVQVCSINYSVSTIVPEGYFLLRMRTKYRLGIPFHDGTIFWHTLSKEELKILERLLGSPAPEQR